MVNAETGSTMLTLRVCGSPLNCLEYNQIGDMVAIGSQNGNFICIFRGYIIARIDEKLNFFSVSRALSCGQ